MLTGGELGDGGDGRGVDALLGVVVKQGNERFVSVACINRC